MTVSLAPLCSECARLIAKEGHGVMWHTPLGLPVVQPYRRKDRQHVRTLLQRLVLVENNDDLPIMKQRQRTAFPPNFIHSIDSSHMMLTAIACKAESEWLACWAGLGSCYEAGLWHLHCCAGVAVMHAGISPGPPPSHPAIHATTHPLPCLPRSPLQTSTLRACTTRSGPTPALWSA
jgi:hypothetical protein